MILEFIRTEHYNATGTALLNANKLLDPRKQGSVHKLIMGSSIAYSMLRNQFKKSHYQHFPHDQFYSVISWRQSKWSMAESHMLRHRRRSFDFISYTL